MRKALELANRAAALGEVPVGALVVSEGKVIGEGWNQPISTHDPSAHAEIMALRAAAKNVKNYRLVNATLYVTIEPCTMCAGAIIHARIARLVYGALEPKAGVAESNGCLFNGSHLNHSVDTLGGIMAEECSHRISQFFQARRLEKKQRGISENS